MDRENRKQLNESIHKNARLTRVREIREQQENLNREYQYQSMLLERRLYQQNDDQLWYDPGANQPIPGPGQVPPPMAPQTPGSMNPSQSYPGHNPGLPFHPSNNQIPDGNPGPSPGFGGGPKRPVPNGPAFPGWPNQGNWWYHPWGFPLYPFIQPPPNVPIMPPVIPSFHGIA